MKMDNEISMIDKNNILYIKITENEISILMDSEQPEDYQRIPESETHLEAIEDALVGQPVQLGSGLILPLPPKPGRFLDGEEVDGQRRDQSGLFFAEQDLQYPEQGLGGRGALRRLIQSCLQLAVAL